MFNSSVIITRMKYLSVRLESHRSSDDLIGMIATNVVSPIFSSVCKERLIMLTHCVLRSVADRINLWLCPPFNLAQRSVASECQPMCCGDISLCRVFTFRLIAVQAFVVWKRILRGTKHDTALGLNSGISSCLNILYYF